MARRTASIDSDAVVLATQKVMPQFEETSFSFSIYLQTLDNYRLANRSELARSAGFAVFESLPLAAPDGSLAQRVHECAARDERDSIQLKEDVDHERSMHTTLAATTLFFLACVCSAESERHEPIVPELTTPLRFLLPLFLPTAT
jgi:hypothetical protein